MTFLKRYFINWYIKFAYFGNFSYSCFLLIWIIGITYELCRTLKKRKRLDYLALEDSRFWKKHYNNNITKQTLMLIIILFEGVQVALGQMDALYIPIHFPLYGNETTHLNNTQANILDCLATNKFVGLGLGVFSIKITVYLYIIWTYSLCLNYCSMTYLNNIEWRKICKPTMIGIMLSSLAPILMASKYTVLAGVFSYLLLVALAGIHLVLSQKEMLRTLKAKRFDLNRESSKQQVRRIDRELKYVKNIGGFVIIIGMVRVVSIFLCGSIGNVIIPIARNPCWVEYVIGNHGAHTQFEGITITIAQVVFSIGKIVNVTYVLMVLTLNVFVGCVYYYAKKIQLNRIVKRKYTTYGKPLTRGLIK